MGMLAESVPFRTKKRDLDEIAPENIATKRIYAR